MKLTLYLIALRQNMTKPPASVCGLSPGGGGGPWVFFGFVCAARTTNWHPVLKKTSPKIDTPF